MRFRIPLTKFEVSIGRSRYKATKGYRSWFWHWTRASYTGTWVSLAYNLRYGSFYLRLGRSYVSVYRRFYTVETKKPDRLGALEQRLKELEQDLAWVDDDLLAFNDRLFEIEDALDEAGINAFRPKLGWEGDDDDDLELAYDYGDHIPLDALR